MSHDRGCPCGREPYEYSTCPRADCHRRRRAPGPLEVAEANALRLLDASTPPGPPSGDVDDTAQTATMRAAIVEFVAAWNELPPGNYSLRQFTDWFSGPRMMRAVEALKRIAG